MADLAGPWRMERLKRERSNQRFSSVPFPRIQKDPCSMVGQTLGWDVSLMSRPAVCERMLTGLLSLIKVSGHQCNKEATGPINIAANCKTQMNVPTAFCADLRCEGDRATLKRLMKGAARSSCSPSSTARTVGTVFLETQTQQSTDMFTFQALWPATVI